MVLYTHKSWKMQIYLLLVLSNAKTSIHKVWFKPAITFWAHCTCAALLLDLIYIYIYIYIISYILLHHTYELSHALATNLQSHQTVIFILFWSKSFSRLSSIQFYISINYFQIITHYSSSPLKNTKCIEKENICVYVFMKFDLIWI